MNEKVIFVAVYRRPALLYLMLERLIKSPEIKDYIVLFCIDHEHDPYINEPIDIFEKNNYCKKVLRITRNVKHNKYLASGNILYGYKDASEITEGLIIPMEEDIFPSDDFLRYTEYVYENYISKYERIFCVAHKRRHEGEQIGDPSLLIGGYQCTSPSCVKGSDIIKYLNPLLANKEYLTNPYLFNVKNYRGFRNPPERLLDHDGQLERLIWRNNLFCLRPDYPRTNHVGYIESKEKDNKNWAETVDTIRKTILDKNNPIYNSPHYTYSDFKSPDWTNIKLDLDRTEAKYSSNYFDPTNKFKEYILNE